MKDLKQTNHKTKESTDLSRMASEWLELSEAIKTLEERKGAIREPLEAHLRLNGNKATIDGISLELIIIDREVFNFKEAKKHIQWKILSPYASETTYTSLKVKR